MIYENPPIYVDPKYWEKRAYAAEYRAGLAEARVAELEGSLASAHKEMLANADEAGKARARVVDLEALCARAAREGLWECNGAKSTTGVLWTTWERLLAAGCGEELKP